MNFVWLYSWSIRWQEMFTGFYWENNCCYANSILTRLHIFLYDSDWWVISKTDIRKIDALDQWCLCMLLGIKWYQFVRNDDVRRLTKQPKLTAIIQSHRLTLFGHLCTWTTTQMPRGSCWSSLRQTGEDNWVVPASRGSAPSNRIWNITILHSPKQQIWLKTALCGGWCRRMALRNRELHARNDDDDCELCELMALLRVFL